ncbi:uncharacterized protein LOC108910396 [Anoplophora glabripennis]|uniref:uncharacterized protein LOC108910396 n=1 Tax=Anoplophora glabripennis TaxID=217634 RepID=UPI000C769D86|nr:uncharacterized protein LOC108910396 [Anoplophora glabripennis]
MDYRLLIIDNKKFSKYCKFSKCIYLLTQVGRDLHLDWNLTTHTYGDCTLTYRVTVEDEDRGEIQDIYVTERSAVLDFVSPCVNYQLRVRAVNRAFPTIEGPVRYTQYQLPPELPSSLQQLFLTSNATLYWFMHPNEPCEITYFQVDIVGDREDEHHFKVMENFVDLSFLEICEKWTFTVTPVSKEVMGFSRALTESLPLPPSSGGIEVSHLQQHVFLPDLRREQWRGVTSLPFGCTNPRPHPQLVVL